MKLICILLICFLLCSCSYREEVPDLGNGRKSITASPNVSVEEYRPDAIYFGGEFFSLKDILFCNAISEILEQLSELCMTAESPAKSAEDFEKEIMNERAVTFKFVHNDTTLSVHCFRVSGDVLDTCEFRMSGSDFALCYDTLELNIFYQLNDQVKLRFINKEVTDDVR